MSGACDSSSAPRGPGSISVTAFSQLQEPGLFFSFGVAIDSGTPMMGFSGDDLSFIAKGLAHGRHVVSMSGVPATCTTGGSVREVTLRGDDTAAVVFDIKCPRTTGDIRVTVTTTGADLDSDGYVVIVNGAPRAFVQTNGSTTIQFFSAGSYVVGLTDVEPNCTAGPSQSANVTAGATVNVTLTVTCTAVSVVKFVTTTTGTDRDPDGYTFTVGSGQPMRGNANGTRFFKVPIGTSNYTIAEIQPNCVVSGPTTGSITLAAGDTATVTVDATCSAVGMGVVGTATTDPAADTLSNPNNNSRPALDLLGVTSRYVSGWLIVVLRFAKPVTPATLGGSNALFGVIDLDVDENAGTGIPPLMNDFGGSASQGSDYVVSLASDTVSGRLFKVSCCAPDSQRVLMKYEGDSVIVLVPLNKLGGDDGNMTITTIIGTQDRPTDWAPNSGVITSHVPPAILVQRSNVRLPGAPHAKASGTLPTFDRSVGDWRRPR